MIRKTSPGCARAAWLALVLAIGCTAAPPDVRTWGTMREVLREGDDRGRVGVLEASGPHTLAVGALAGLEGEVTVLEGVSMVALGSTGEFRLAHEDDRAALLVAADVPAWRQVTLPRAAMDLATLEEAVAAALRQAGFDLDAPVPVRVRGFAREVACHVIAGACPIARPEGPPPRRVERHDVRVELVGVHAEGRAGELTHHTNRSHLHVLGPAIMGHLDAITLSDAVLLFPDLR